MLRSRDGWNCTTLCPQLPLLQNERNFYRSLANSVSLLSLSVTSNIVLFLVVHKKSPNTSSSLSTTSHQDYPGRRGVSQHQPSYLHTLLYYCTTVLLHELPSAKCCTSSTLHDDLMKKAAGTVPRSPPPSQNIPMSTSECLRSQRPFLTCTQSST